jgi:hypothetical protein
MTMDWQLGAVVACLAAAAAYLGRRAWRAWSGRCGGCCSGGGAAPGGRLIGADELTARLRRRD